MNNKKIGNSFEAEFCEILYEEGFWVHNMAQNASGQPADVIAVRDGKAYLIDCKVCSNKKFALSRIEDNQHLAMEMWRDCGNSNGWFAIRIDGEIIMVPYFRILELSKQQSIVGKSTLRARGCSILKWLEEV